MTQMTWWLKYVSTLAGTPTKGSMMCMTRHLSWVLGWLVMHTWPDHKVHWWPLLGSLSMLNSTPVRLPDTFWGLDDIYWCSVPGWTVLCLAGVTGCQLTVTWWSQQCPQEGNNCVVINVIITLSCTAFCFAPCVDVWIHIWCNYCNKHIFDFWLWLWNC